MTKDDSIQKRMEIINYLKKYPDLFTKEEMNHILYYATSQDINYFHYSELLREIYDELGFIPEEENLYIGFLNLVKSVFEIEDKNIIEIGGGILPRFAERMAKEQKKGKIIVYDPRLSIYKEDTDKLTLVRKEFDKKIDIKGIDLLIGLMPCKAAETIVDVAVKNNIDFIIGLCEGGPHGENFDYFEDEYEWRHSVIYSAKTGVEMNNMGKLKTKYLREYHDPYPIIYNERESG